MKIWVLAVNGMLGSALFDCCQRKGLEVVGTSHREADITDLAHLFQKSQEIQPTHIVNCAAYTDVDGAEKNPEAAYAINAKGAGNVAQMAKHCGARLIHLSTDYVFNGKESKPYLENDFCEPANIYGQSKYAGEIQVLECLPTACIVRTSWLFGPKGKNFISSVLKWLQEKEELQVTSDQCGKPTFCNDLAEAVLALLSAEGIVHFANDGERSRYQIALDMMQAAKALGHPLRCQRIVPVLSAQFPTVAVRPAYSVLDTSKYSSITNRKPRHWGEIVNEFVNYALSI